MNELEQALEFNIQLDNLLTENGLLDESSDHADLLKLANTLSTTDFSDETSIRQSLLERLNDQQRQSFRKLPIYRQHPLVAGFVAALIVISIVFTVPPIRTLAQEIIKHLRGITLTNAPSLMEPYLTGTPPADVTNPNQPAPNLSLAEAITKAGFTPLVPTYLPEGYVLTLRDARIGQISSDFEPAGIDTSKCCVIFSIRQLKMVGKQLSPYQYPVGDVPIVDVVVRNNPGFWVQNAEIGLNKDANGDPQIMPGNLLTWEEGDSLFWMTSFDARTNIPLSKEEMMKVANSLQLPAN